MSRSVPADGWPGMREVRGPVDVKYVPFAQASGQPADTVQVLSGEQIAAALADAAQRLLTATFGAVTDIPAQGLRAAVTEAVYEALDDHAPSERVNAFEDCLDLVWLAGGPSLGGARPHSQVVTDWVDFLLDQLPA